MSATTALPEMLKAPPERHLYTYDELCEVMEETNQPHELWDGELVIMASPFFQHQDVVWRFYRALFDWVTKHLLGKVVFSPLDMVLAPHQMVQPDVAFIAKERLHIIQNVLRGPADLVAEVISPGGRQRDRINKRDL